MRPFEYGNTITSPKILSDAAQLLERHHQLLQLSLVVLLPFRERVPNISDRYLVKCAIGMHATNQPGVSPKPKLSHALVQRFESYTSFDFGCCRLIP
ncbi:unnamed protein product, partial [Clonostachys rhizophaga]